MTLSNFYQGYFVPASTLLPIIAGLLSYRKLHAPVKALMLYLYLSLLTNVVASILAAQRINNLPLLHFYTMFELLAVLYYYQKAFDNKKVNTWIKAIMVAYPLLCIINFTCFQSIYQFNTYTRPLEAAIIIAFSILYLAEQHNFEKQKLVTTSGRLVAYGFLVYFCSSLFQFIFSNVVSHHASRFVKMTIWNLHATFVLIMYVFFYLAIRNEKPE